MDSGCEDARTPRHQDDGKVPGVTHAGAPDQRLGSRKAQSLGGSRERSGRGEFFMRSRMISTTFLNLSNADAASKSQKSHFTSRQSCGGYRVKKLGASPSSRPLRRPAAAHLLPAAACLAAALPHILLPKFCYTTNSSPGLNLAAAGVGTRAVDCLRVETEGVSLRTDRKA